MPTGLARIVDTVQGRYVASVVATYGPIRNGQRVLPAEKFTPSGDAHAVAGHRGRARPTFIGGPGRQDLKAPQMVVFLDKGREDGVAPGDLFEIRRRAERLPDGRQLINEVMATLQVVHVRDHTATAPPHQHPLARHPAGHRRAAGRQAPVLTSGSEAVTRRRGAPRRRVAFPPVPGSFLGSRIYIAGRRSIPSVIPGRRDHGETRRMSGRVLVTGGAGFIGSHIAEAYLRRVGGRRARRSLARARAERAEGRAVRLRRHSLARGAAAARHREVRRAEPSRGADRRARLGRAARASTRASTSSGFVNLLEGAGEGGVKRVVFASSGGVVYGDPEVIPTPETAPKLPVCPYGVSKLADEYYPRALGALRGFQGVAMRYANVFGPRQDPKSEAGVVSIFVSRLLAGEKLTVFGDGRQTRDYVFVRDVARANVLATTVTLPATGEFDAPGLQHRHLGPAQRARAGRRGRQVMGRKPELEFAPPRAGRALPQRARHQQGQGVLKWTPEWKFEDGLRQLVEWFEKEGAVILQAGGAVPRSAVELVLTASAETKIVLVITAVFSLVSWFIIVLKWWQFRKLNRQADKFFAEMERTTRLQEAYHAVMKQPPSPYNRLFREAITFYSELRPGALREERGADRSSLTPTQLEALKMVLGKEVSAERDLLGHYIHFFITGSAYC